MCEDVGWVGGVYVRCPSGCGWPGYLWAIIGWCMCAHPRCWPGARGAEGVAMAQHREAGKTEGQQAGLPLQEAHPQQ